MSMAVRELSRVKFQGPTRPVVNPVTSTVATTATEILRNNPDRYSWVIVNLSANRGFIGFDREVSSTKGIPIEASGGVVNMQWEEDGEVTTYAVFAINLVASGTWYIVEFERF